MKNIQLTQGKFAIVDDDMFEELNQFKWYAEKRKDTFYARRNERNRLHVKKFYMHRQIMNVTDPKIQVDHIFGDGLDNRREKLRLCTMVENLRNQRARVGETSIYKGVFWDKSRNRWGCQIVNNGVKIHIGRFINETYAAEQYNLKASELFGEFARLNTF